MTRYLDEPKDQIHLEGYAFAKNMSKNVDRIISKNLSDKKNQKLLDHAKQLKASSKRAIQKTAEGTGDLIGNKIGFQIIHLRVIQRLIHKQISIELPKIYIYIYISREKRQQIIDDLRFL